MPKINITVSQAILILIEHYQNVPNLSSKEKEKIERLKRIYIGGVKSKSDKDYIFKLIKNESSLFIDFDIQTDAKAITKDPTKRYFETILSQHLHESLLNDHDLSAITEKYLENVFAYIKNVKPNFWELSAYHKRIQQLINGEQPKKIKETNRYHTFNRLFAEAYESLTYAQNNEALKKLLLSSYLPAFCTQLITGLPLSIYGAGIYSDENRGLVKDFNVDTKTPGALESRTFGILERSMPAPRTLISDNTYAMKPTGRAYFEESAQWPKQSFMELTHPFVASISGTILAHLRILLYQLQQKDIKFTNILELKNYLIRYISTLLYYGGGHSLREFTGVFDLKETKNEFTFYFKEFNKEINLLSLFKDQFQKIFDKSIDEVIQYNRTIIQKNKLHRNIQAMGRKNEEQSEYINKNKEKIDSEILSNFIPYINKHNKELASKIMADSSSESKLLSLTKLINNCHIHGNKMGVNHHLSRQALRDLIEIINNSPAIKIFFEKFHPLLLEDRPMAILQKKFLTKHSDKIRYKFHSPDYHLQVKKMRKICFEELSKYYKDDFISKSATQIYTLFELDMTSKHEIAESESHFLDQMDALKNIFLNKKYMKDAEKIDQIKHTYEFLLSKNCPEIILEETKNEILNTFSKMILNHKPVLLNLESFTNFKTECIKTLSDLPISRPKHQL